MKATVALDVVHRPKTTPIHELERYMRCKDRSQVRGYPCERSHLVALRQRKISASNPPSTWWPGERLGRELVVVVAVPVEFKLVRFSGRVYIAGHAVGSVPTHSKNE